MKNLTGKIELLANVAIIIVAVLLGTVLVKSYLSPALNQPLTGSPSTARKTINKGGVINLSDINWQENGNTLLLALSSTCHFCTESGPFYQRIVRESGNTRMIALVPQSVAEGQQYLKRLGVGIGEVRQVSLSELGLSGTPTLILVDGNGKIAEVWVGALSADKENEVISRLRVERVGK
ncbi:MAG: hypothetical protein LC802_04155 [Acidobacteria bacterium]|nr:hypothetical protein [Acidobacteriota bacterium]